MKTQMQLQPEMGAKIIQHLRQFGDLPGSGVLAGQAVDSAISDLFGKGGGVYNDLDIFRQVKHLKGARKVERVANTATRCQITAKVASDGYRALNWMLDTVNTYHIESVSRTGLLNYVNCTTPKGQTDQLLTPHRVITGFDLNCVRVGVDLKTQNLYWDHHYEEFRRSRQLKISMLHTPWHTFGRLCKKLEELPDVYANVEQSAYLCTAFANSRYIDSLKQGGHVSLLFGQKYRALMEKFSSYTEKYFDMDPVEKKASDGSPVTLYAFGARCQVDKDIQSRVDRLGVGALLFTGKTVETAMAKRNACVQLKLDTLKSSRPDRCQSDATDATDATDAVEVPPYDFIGAQAFWFDVDYVKGQALPEVAEKVNAFCDKHPGLRKVLIGLSLAQQWEAIGRLQAIARKYGKEHFKGDSQAALGILETSLDAQSAIRKDTWLEDVLQRELCMRNEPFNITPLSLPSFGHNPAFRVKELSVAVALDLEGLQMKHCVAGYAPKVRANLCRIISIRTGPAASQWSTLELINERRVYGPNREAKDKWGVAQHRGFKNCTPAAMNLEIEKSIVAHLSVATWQRQGMGLQLVSIHAALLSKWYKAMYAGLARIQRQLANFTNKVNYAAIRAERHATAKTELRLTLSTLNAALGVSAASPPSASSPRAAAWVHPNRPTTPRPALAWAGVDDLDNIPF